MVAVGFTSGDERKLNVAGGTMTGPLVLDDDPAQDLEAATKQYVDDAITGVDGDVTGKVAKAGDTMTGALVLPGAPVSDLQAATKKYADDQDALRLALTGGTLTGALVLSGSPASGLHAATKAYVDAADATATAGALLVANNLSDLASAATARTNLGASQALTATSKTADYTAVAGDFVKVDATSGAVAITLPTGVAGSVIGVRKTDSSTNAVTVSDGGTTSVTLSLQDSSRIFIGSTGSYTTTVAGQSTTGLDTRYARRSNNLSDLASASTARTNLGLGTVASAITLPVFSDLNRSSKQTGDATNRFEQFTDGYLKWGDGTAATDTVFYRSAAGVLKTDGALSVGTSVLGATFAPSDHGYQTWTIDPALAGTGSVLNAAGAMHLLKVKLPVAATISTACLFLTALATGTVANCFVALYDSGGTRRAVTADLSSSWASPGATGYLEHAFATPYAAAAGTYYVGLLAGTASTLLPAFSRNASSLVSNAGLTAGSLRFSTYSSGLSAAPSSVTLASQVVSASAMAASYFVGLK